MKIRPEQLSTYLNKNLAPLYVLSGNELVLLEDALVQIKQTAQQHGYTEIHTSTVDAHFNWETWLTSSLTPSLFSPRLLFILHLPSGKPGDKGSQVLQQYSKQMSEDRCLILILPKLDASTYKTKWWQALEQTGIVIPFWPLDKIGQKNWLLQQLPRFHYQMTTEAIDFLVEQTLGNLLALRQYLLQFNLIYPAQYCIDIKDLQTQIFDQGQFDIFTLVDACNQGDAISCLRILKKLQANGTEAILIVWAITRELRQLQEMQQKFQSGMAFDMILKEFRVPLTRKNSLYQAIKRCSTLTLLSLLQQATAVDAAIKGHSSLPLWPTLERWILEYCGVKGL